MNQTCFDEEQLLALAEGARPIPDDVAIEGHLATCATCASLLARLVGATWLADDGRAAPATEAGRQLGPYRLERRIGAGGMGEVFSAWDERLGRRVAVKLLSPGIPGGAQRLVREARAAAAISHANVVTVHDVVQADGVSCVVTELIEGESLRSLLDRGGVPRERALALGLQLVRGVAAAHARGIIHRDLNPRNILVATGGELKILDFGLAKGPPSGGERVDETAPGTVVGTMGYLAPEQARGEGVDARSDLFAVGAILYELVTGERAFAGDTSVERLSSLLRDTPPRLADPSLGALGPILRRCLERDPARRFQSADDLAFVLASAADPGTRPARLWSRRSLVLGAFAGAGLGLVGGRLIGRPTAGPGWRPLTFRRGRVTQARATPDGTGVIYGASWDGLSPSVQLITLAGGGERPIEPPGADLLAVSSLGDLALSLDRRFVRGMHSAGRLFLGSLARVEPRLLAEEVQDADFSPDGRELAIIRRAEGGFRLEWPLGSVFHESERWLAELRISPDGRSVACLEHPDASDDRGDVVVLDRATRARRVVSEGWSSLVGLAWNGPDELWFAAASQGDDAALHGFALSGKGRRLAQTPGRLRLHDRLPGERALVTQDHRRLVLRVTGRGHRDTDLSLSDVSVAQALSADGELLLAGELGGGAGARHGAYLRRLAGGPPLRVGDGAPLSLSADGRRVLAELQDPVSRLVVYDLGGQPARQLAIPGITWLRWARFAGASAIVLGGSAADRPPRLWWLEGDAPPRPLSDEGTFGRGWPSPDGRRVAFVHAGRLRLVSPAGAPHETPGELPDHVVCGWHANGREVFVRRTRAPWELVRVDVETGSAATLMTITPPSLGLRGLDATVVSASGEVCAYSHGEELSRLFLLELGGA